MSRNRPLIILFAALIVVGIAGYWVSHHNSKPKGPLELSFWYWHSPYSLTDDDRNHFKTFGVQKVFVRAGTFTTDGKNVLLKFPQSFVANQESPPVHLVFNFDAGLIRHFEELDLNLMSRDISTRILNFTEQVRKKGLTVQGIQLDFDCPTRLLPRYGDLVKAIRDSSPEFNKKHLQVSATGLTSWLGDGRLHQLTSRLDFFVPQFYEGQTGLNLAQLRPISDPSELQRAIPFAEDLECPYYIGVPTYGRAFLYDQEGHIVGNYPDLSPSDALRHPSLQYVNAYPVQENGQPAKNPKDAIGENILELKAIKPDRQGHGLGYTLVYNLPSPHSLKLILDEVRRIRGGNCEGIVFFRVPEADGTLSLPYRSIDSALSGKIEGPKIEVSLTAQTDNYDLVDSGPKHGVSIQEYVVTVTNKGDAPTAANPDGLILHIRFSEPGILDANPHSFHNVKVGIAGEGNAQIQPSSLRSANAVDLQFGYLMPGQTIRSGPIRVLAQSKPAKLSWSFETMEGTSVAGQETRSTATGVAK